MENNLEEKVDYNQFPLEVRIILYGILHDHINQGLINQALNVSEENWNKFTFIRILGGTNEEHLQEVKEVILDDLEVFFEEHPEYLKGEI